MIRISKTIFTCDKCSKEIEYHNDKLDGDNFNGDDFTKANQCWSINLGRAGYGSKLDGSEVKFDICDDCLYEFISSFNHSDRVFNSGSNYYYTLEDDDFEDDE